MSKITCENYRRFGVEIELNTTTNKIKDKNSVPDGAPLIAEIIQGICSDPVCLNGWLHVNNNDGWVIKPDSTCGIEINSPILKGYYDLCKLSKLVQELEKNPEIKADSRCSFHVHVNLEDLPIKKIYRILVWWIKCEAVFFDAVPAQRKCHRHAQMIGMSDRIDCFSPISGEHILRYLSDCKYHSVNCYHMRMERRKSMEFRIAGNEFCLNPIFVSNWIRLLLHFVDVASQTSMPKNYIPNNPMTGLAWLSPKETFKFLKFDQDLSLGMKQVKNWFLKQMRKNAPENSLGVWQPGVRSPAIKEIREMLNKEEDLFTDVEKDTLLFSKEYCV